MKIAVATDDKKTIHRGHFGLSRYYRIIEILNGEIVSEELRENPHAVPKEGQSLHGQTERIIELLPDCELFMARNMGKNSLTTLSLNHIDCILTTEDDVHRAIASYLEGRDEGFKYYDVNIGDFVPCSERPIK